MATQHASQPAEAWQSTQGGLKMCSEEHSPQRRSLLLFALHGQSPLTPISFRAHRESRRATPNFRNGRWLRIASVFFKPGPGASAKLTSHWICQGWDQTDEIYFGIATITALDTTRLVEHLLRLRSARLHHPASIYPFCKKSLTIVRDGICYHRHLPRGAKYSASSAGITSCTSDGIRHVVWGRTVPSVSRRNQCAVHTLPWLVETLPRLTTTN
ncbi:hypothetical protein LXA43DRAFT_239949 [Ganoderma leucocontextum]|nr:hypothetical protein LXA43DRAFT_239949 [Ganoderma leucocontextum]